MLLVKLCYKLDYILYRYLLCSGVDEVCVGDMPLTMTMPADCSAVRMLIMGAMPIVVPWKYTPLWRGRER